MFLNLNLYFEVEKDYSELHITLLALFLSLPLSLSFSTQIYYLFSLRNTYLGI